MGFASTQTGRAPHRPSKSLCRNLKSESHLGPTMPSKIGIPAGDKGDMSQHGYVDDLGTAGLLPTGSEYTRPVTV